MGDTGGHRLWGAGFIELKVINNKTAYNVALKVLWKCLYCQNFISPECVLKETRERYVLLLKDPINHLSNTQRVDSRCTILVNL